MRGVAGWGVPPPFVGLFHPGEVAPGRGHAMPEVAPTRGSAVSVEELAQAGLADHNETFCGDIWHFQERSETSSNVGDFDGPIIVTCEQTTTLT